MAASREYLSTQGRGLRGQNDDGAQLRCVDWLFGQCYRGCIDGLWSDDGAATGAVKRLSFDRDSRAAVQSRTVLDLTWLERVGGSPMSSNPSQWFDGSREPRFEAPELTIALK